MIWIGILIALLFSVLVLLLAKININLKLIYSNDNQFLLLELILFNIHFYRRKIALQYFLEEEVQFENYSIKLKEWKGILQSSGNILSLLLKNLRFHMLNWKTSGGTGDASVTGTVTGVIWSIKGIILGQLMEKSNLYCQPSMTVDPHFQSQFFKTEFECMVSIRVGQAIHVFFKGLRIISPKKSLEEHKRRRTLKWKNILFKA